MGVRPRSEGEGGIQHLSRRLGAMKPWERVVFGLIALTVLAAIGVKLHELDMPVARFVRSFDIDGLNRLGDLVALPGQGVVVAGAFILIALIGWRRQRDQLAPMTFSMAGLIEWVRTWWPQRDQLTDIGVRGLLAQLSVAGAIQILKHLIGRPRPRFAHGDELVLGPSLDSGLDSFPSGHAANAFGAALVSRDHLPRGGDRACARGWSRAGAGLDLSGRRG